MSSRLRKSPLAIVLALVAMLALSACGDSHTRVTTGTYAGESGQNAPYLDVGPLKYEVQLSRELNPTNSEDASYLQGLSEEERKLWNQSQSDWNDYIARAARSRMFSEDSANSPARISRNGTAGTSI